MIDIRRAATRFHTDVDWLNSWHSFSFGPHYDPANTHHGLLLVSNDDRVAPGQGFGIHSHRDMEIVTWVISGRLRHHDSEGNEGEIYPGLAQRMSAGSGISHSEMNASTTEEAHFVQMWVAPDTSGIAPGYEQRDLGNELDGGGLHAIASGQQHPGAVTIHQRDAVLWGARIASGGDVTVPVAPHVHVFVARGTATLGTGDQLQAGDAARLTDERSMMLTSGASETEVLIWATA
jgi:redox-sensitive bicupin YhaK (pirin superfamily)